MSQLPQQEPIEQQDNNSPQSDENTTTCDVCSSTFSSRSNLKRHQKEVHEAVRKTCVICSKSLYSDSALRRHLNKCTGPSVDSQQHIQDDDDLSIDVRSNAEQLAHSGIASGAIEHQLLLDITKDLRQYLRGSPVTYLEHRLIQSRLNESSEKLLLRTMRFVLSIILGLHLVPGSSDLNTRLFTNKLVVIAIHYVMQKRKVGPVRVHAVFLLIAKTLLHITSMAKRTGGPKGIHFEANMISSWSFVRSVIDSSSKEKKQTAASKMDTDSSLMNTSQLARVASETVAWLRDFCEKQAQEPELGIITRAEASMYAKYLLVCMLSNHPSQRSEVFRLLEPEKTMFLVPQEGSTDIQSAQVWEIRVPPALTKSNKPVVMQFTPQISRFIDVYNNAIRPLLFTATAPHSNLLFPDKNANPRSDFSLWTRQITQEIIGIQVNAHSFRHAQITSLYNDPNTSTMALESMANSMGHTLETQRTFYRSIQHRRQSADSTKLLQNLYRQAAGPEEQQIVAQQQLPVPVASSAPIVQPSQQSSVANIQDANDGDDDVIDITDKPIIRVRPYRRLFQHSDIDLSSKRAMSPRASDPNDPWADEFNQTVHTHKRQRKARKPTVVQRWTGTQLDALREAMKVYGNQWAKMVRDKELVEQLGNRTVAQIRSKAFHLNQIDAQRNIATSSKDTTQLINADEEADISFDDEEQLLFDDD